jgi:3-oxoacyl-[acyl-carrier-protein] synthase II
LEQPDPSCDLVHVPHVGVEIPRARAVLSNAFGFGGMDTILVLCDPEIDRRVTGESTRMSVPGTTRGLASLGASEPPVVTGVAVFGPAGLLGISECATLVDAAARRAPHGAVDPEPLLDPSRARRLDRAARLGAVVAARAAAEATVPMADVGIVLGSAFGNVDESAAFMHRVFEKGPRSASPAEFPNLVPSSPVGHVTIYSGSHGPAFAVTDLATSGESAFAQAFELVNAEDGHAIIAGAAEPRSDIVDRVLCRLFAHAPSQWESPRADLAAAVVIERADAPRARGTPSLARVTQVLQWRADAMSSLAELRPPGDGRTEVILPRLDGGVFELLDQTAWRARPRLSCAPGLGESDALGAVAIAVASARVGRGLATGALVVGLARGRGYAIVLEAA